MMVKNTVLKKLIAILLVAVFLFSLSVISSAEKSENNQTEYDAQISDIEIEDSYEKYCEKYSSESPAKKEIRVSLNAKLEDKPIEFTVEAGESGLYNIGMSYIATSDKIGELEIGLKLNGEYPFEDASKLSFPHMWKDETESRVDGLGNEFAAKQIPFDEFYFNLACDISKETEEQYMVYLPKGKTEISLVPVNGEAEIEYFEFGVNEEPEKYAEPKAKEMLYNGESIVIEGEKPYVKSSYWLSAKNDNSSINISPNSASKSLINFIGGDNWKTIGETIVWETPHLKEGYYKIGTSFRQSAVIGGKVYRKLTIDGKVPFSEAQTLGFEYDDNWQSEFFSDDKGEAYLIYLSEGKHKIGLTAVPGRISEVQEHLKKALADLGSLYIDITMIVGETVDMYRDYDLFDQIPDMEQNLKSIEEELQKADKVLQAVTGQENGSDSSVIKSMSRVIGQMLDNRYTAHRYKSEYYNRYSALAAVLYEMQNMPLDIDRLVLASPEQEYVVEKADVFNKLWFSVKKFVFSFINDYNNISVTNNDLDALTIWVNWGRDQVQVLNSLVQTSFTAEHDIPVNIKLVNASIVQAILSGKGPDCILQRSRTEPVDLAMRGVLYDLNKFDDLEEVLTRFQDGAALPYRYKDGLYALPDTQTFFLMFYRTDIMNQLGLEIPETWDEFRETAKLLARSNLNVWIPNNVVTDLNQASAGIGSINIFPSMLLQNGLQIYTDNGRKTNFTNTEIMTTFSQWTDMYRKLKLPTAIDFYNRFRTGTCPIGISSYVLYTTLKAAAPEIEGLWAVTPIPGTTLEDGTVDKSSAGAGTGCAILKETKNPENAWRFIKWWTSAETQLAYSNEIEAVLGPTGRISVANVEAFKNMDWDLEMLDSMLEAWSQVKELPEYPGSYYVSRSLYQSFWNVVENNRNPKDMLIKYGKQADMEMNRKWKQYENR